MPNAHPSAAPQVSVLVAVYNARPWLDKCLSSLLAQTLTDFQVLCVDDCSTDGSWDMLQQYALRDPRIEIYRMGENSGQAKARNEALRHARGRYVAFLDSDDWLNADALEACVKVFEAHPATDCVLMRCIIERNGKLEDYDKPIPMLMSGMEAVKASIDWSIHGIYVTRLQFYQQWPYDTTCRTYSDDNTSRIHFYHSREVRYAPAAIYYYRCNATSATQKATVRRFDHLRANESMRRQLVEMDVPQELLSQHENQRWLVLVDCYMFYHVHDHELAKADRRFGLSEMRRVWGNVDRSLLNRRITAKFGYRPCSRWWLFRLQEWLYFTLRGLQGKNY